MTTPPAAYTLETLGFDPSWQGAAIRAAFTLDGTLDDFTLARVSAVHRTRCELLTCEQGELVKLSAPLRPVENDYGEEEYPVVGDWVLAQPIPGTGGETHPSEHKLLVILPRRSYLTRPSATRESADQPVAANVDMLCIVEPCFPEPSIGRIERYTALAHASGVQVALILTKGDLVTAEQLAGYRESLGAAWMRYSPSALTTATTLPRSRSSLPGAPPRSWAVAAPENPPSSTPCSTPELTPARTVQRTRCR